MPSPIRIRSKEEKRLIDTASALLDDPTASTADKFKAMGYLERAIRLAEKRRIRRQGAELDGPTAEPQPAEPESVEDLVQALEKAEKQPLQPIESEGLKNDQNGSNPIEPAVEPPTAAHKELVTPTRETAPTAFCAFCSEAGSWNTRFPVGQADGVLLCPACFSKMCAADMRQTAAAALARQQTPPDWAGDFAAQRNINSSDFEKSRAIWAEQDRENADRQDQERIERARAEAQYHAARARWIQDGGRL